MLNEIDSAGDKIHDISKIKYTPTMYKSCLLYFWNFEIWGSYKKSERKTLCGRREVALNELNNLTNRLVIAIKEFQLNNTNYEKYVSSIIMNISKVLLYFDILRTTLSKKKQELTVMDYSDK